MLFDEILARLDGVKRFGDSKAVAKCPAHDDGTPSLTLKDNDGTILLHCFGGCDSLAVCAAIGIEYADLFPDRRIRRIDANERRTGLPAIERLALIEHEVAVVLFIAADMQAGKMDDERLMRLAAAVSRIGSAANG